MLWVHALNVQKMKVYTETCLRLSPRGKNILLNTVDEILKFCSGIWFIIYFCPGRRVIYLLMPVLGKKLVSMSTEWVSGQYWSILANINQWLEMILTFYKSKYWGLWTVLFIYLKHIKKVTFNHFNGKMIYPLSAEKSRGVSLFLSWLCSKVRC